MTLIDTDFLYACFFESQSTHQQSLLILSQIENDPCYILNLNIQELATVISNKESHELSFFVLDKLNDLDLEVVKLTDDEELEIWKLFRSQKKNKISFIDCANLYIAQSRNFKIASFDRFYPQSILVKP
jgi:predicted nucleic acid-binding protein